MGTTFSASGASEKEEEVKIAILPHTIGEEASEVYNTLHVIPSGDDDILMEDVLMAFKEYCSPLKNVVFERHQFWSHSMSSGITVDRFITELRQKSKDCEFGRSEDDMMRDKLVFSINDPRVKERLLREIGLTLQRAIDICRLTELGKAQIQVMQVAPITYDAPIDAVEKTKRHK